MARFCPQCGTTVQDDQTFCPNCGTRVALPEASQSGNGFPPYTAQEANTMGDQPYGQPVYPNGGQGFGPRCATKKEFLQLPENKKLRSQLLGTAIICYISGGLTLLLMLFSMNLMMLLDVALLVGLGLGVHLAYSPGVCHPAGGLCRLQRPGGHCGQRHRQRLADCHCRHLCRAVYL